MCEYQHKNIFLNRPDVTIAPFTDCSPDVPTALNKLKHDPVR